ncbi:MAG: hypothetical protein NDI58_08195 [Geothrix sp.]|nr:hypothetical protein [Geothrix sp.]
MSVHRFSGCLLLLLGLTGPGWAQPPAAPVASGLGRYRAVHAALLARQDAAAALALMEGPEVDGDPGLLYLKAVSLARLGRREAALGLAARLEALDPGFHAATDPEFAKLAPPPRAQGPVGRLRTVARLSLPGLFPEGLAVDAATGRTFLSSLVQGGVLVLEPGRRPRWFLRAGPEGPWETLGLKVDPARRLLWVASKGRPGRAGLGQGAAERSALFAVDLDTGRVARRVVLPDPGRHLLNDLALQADGTVFVTDSEAGAVYRVPPGEDRFETVLPAGSLSYPNGLVLTKDGAGLLVAGAGPGLYRVDLAGDSFREVRVPPGLHLQGIDGLTRLEGPTGAGSRLVAVQNGIHPGRVALLELDEAETELLAIRILAAGQAALEGIPTTGDLAGTAYRFIANSQIPLLQGKGPRPRPKPFLIVEVELPD